MFRDLLPVSWTPSQVPPLELMIAGMIILEIIIIDTYIMPTLPGTLTDALHIFLPSGEKIVKKVNFSCSSCERESKSTKRSIQAVIGGGEEMSRAQCEETTEG